MLKQDKKPKDLIPTGPGELNEINRTRARQPFLRLGNALQGLLLAFCSWDVFGVTVALGFVH
jgi:hypothetical protein